jgi:hypothetical protein
MHVGYLAIVVTVTVVMFWRQLCNTGEQLLPMRMMMRPVQPWATSTRGSFGRTIRHFAGSIFTVICGTICSICIWTNCIQQNEYLALLATMGLSVTRTPAGDSSRITQLRHKCNRMRWVRHWHNMRRLGPKRELLDGMCCEVGWYFTMLTSLLLWLALRHGRGCTGTGCQGGTSGSLIKQPSA